MELDANGMPKTQKAPVSLMRSKVGGLVFILLGLGMAYFFMLRPLQEAQRTGTLQYSIKGILIAPLAVYLGIAMLLTDMRDGQTRTIGPDGKARLTRKGWWFVGGMMAVIAATLGAWFWYLHAAGFQSTM